MSARVATLRVVCGHPAGGRRVVPHRRHPLRGREVDAEGVAIGGDLEQRMHAR